MEEPVSIQPAESPLPQARPGKFLGLSILAGFFYGIPTLLVGFMASAILIGLAALIVLPSIFPALNSLDTQSLDLEMKLLVGLAVVMALGSALIAGLVGSRTAYMRANSEGSFRQTGSGMASCAGIGLLGMLVFPILCYAGYFASLALLQALQLQESGIYGSLLGGTESGNAAILIICIPSIGIVLAYLVALLSGALISRRLKRKPQAIAQ
jgi:hypothetical protein